MPSFTLDCIVLGNSKNCSIKKPHGVSTSEENAPGSQREAGRPAVFSAKKPAFSGSSVPRLGLSQKDLGHRFNIPQSTVSRIFNEGVNAMSYRLGGAFNVAFTTCSRKAHAPKDFKEKPSHPTVILDATEIKCEAPVHSFYTQSHTDTTSQATLTSKG